ncbi:MAG TPA: FkbM family methyltransferase [Steroidobacteraceae bacterium]
MLLKRVLSKISGSSYIQKCLERNVQVSQYLMGVGSGSDVLSSGEQSIFRVLKQRFRPPYCIFDVGSNRGQFLQVVVDNIASEDLSIHCFEPGHETFKSLVEHSKKLEKYKGIKLNNIGIGKEQGEAVLHFDRLGSGLASLTKRKLDHHGIDFEESEKVEIGTIDNYCLENAINHINLLKIDIEGHELDALVSAKRMFEAKSIDMVSFEFGGTNIDTRTFFRDFWYFFTGAEMRIFRITPSGYLSPIDSYNEIHEQFAPTNFIAVSTG